jgi:uncharacterized integral membrane protein
LMMMLMLMLMMQNDLQAEVDWVQWSASTWR